MTAGQHQMYEFEGFLLDPRRRRLTRPVDGRAVPLTPRVFDTLLCLVENEGETLSKDRLLSAVWPNLVVEENNLAQNISTLRRLLGEKPGDHRFIVTVPGRGYCFVASVRHIRNNDAAGEALSSDIGGGRGLSVWGALLRSVSSLGRFSADAL